MLVVFSELRVQQRFVVSAAPVDAQNFYDSSGSSERDGGTPLISVYPHAWAKVFTDVTALGETSVA